MKKHHLFFIITFAVIILMQTFYWLFANSAKPIIMGMPFGMFVIVLLIIIEFIALLVLYYLDEIKPYKKEKE